MPELSRQLVENSLRDVIDPYAGKDLVSTGAVRSVKVEGGKVTVEVVLGYPAAGFFPTLAGLVRDRVAKIEGVTGVDVKVTTEIKSHAVQKALKPIPGIKNIIAVASGKGGVGKSTTTANLALALAREGARVGILDADIYGPSQPLMMGLSGQRPESPDGETMNPLEAHGVQVMSIGFMIDEDTPMIWRGPMVTQALEQMLNTTNWRDLDYLVIDLPPGTGDTQLTLAQKIPVSGAVIVTTPQDIALLDARKGLKMFEKVEVPVLGIVENMSIHVCSNCGHAEHIFGQGGGERMAKDYGVEFLGALPLDIRIREQADGGMPTVVADPEGPAARMYVEIARKAAARLALQSKDYSAKFPKIVIQNS